MAVWECLLSSVEPIKGGSPIGVSGERAEPLSDIKDGGPSTDAIDKEEGDGSGVG